MKFTLGIIAGSHGECYFGQSGGYGFIDPANIIIFDISTDAERYAKKDIVLQKRLIFDSAETYFGSQTTAHAQILKNNSFINVKCLISIWRG